MDDKAFLEWLFAPLSMADLMQLELAAAAREHALIEARMVADALMAETERMAEWDRIAAAVALRDLAEAADLGLRERPRRHLASV
jgi:hypothetical protein